MGETRSADLREPAQQTPLAAQLAASWPFLWPSAYFVLHTLEELPGFAAWATRHFGPLSSLTFATTHIPMVLVVFAASYQAMRRGRHGGWVVLAAAAGIQFGLNGLFHLATAVAFVEYSPGMLTAACLGLPGSVVYVAWLHRTQRLTPPELVVAAALGAAVAAAAIGALYLH